MGGPADLRSGVDLATTGGGCTGAFPCWENPLPHGNPIRGVWGRSSTDIWAVGGGGVIQHYDGATWSLVASPTTATLTDVWAAAADRAFAVGQGGIIARYDGAAWSLLTSGTTLDLAAVWGSGPDDVWAAAERSERPDPLGPLVHTFLHWNGLTWTRSTAIAPEASATQISDLWGCSASEVYAVGSNGKGVVFRWDGTRFTSVMTGSSSSSYPGVWCSGAGRPAWFAYNACPMGLCSAKLSGDGTTWARSEYAVGAIAGSGPSDLWTAARSYNAPSKPHLTLHWNGTIWEELADTVLAPRFSDRPGSHFRWSGYDANIPHRDSLAAPWVPSVQGPLFELRGIWGTDPDNLWAVGERGTILRRSRGSWSPVSSPSSGALMAIWGAAADQLWAVGSDGILASDGMRWVTLSTGVRDLLAISGSGPRDVWAAGKNRLLHFDGLGWTTVSTTFGGRVLFARGPSDAWLVDDSAVRHFDGTTWQLMPLPSDTFSGVWASGPRDAWIVGGQDFYHFDGTSFSTVAGGVERLTGAIWGSRAGDVWARGSRGGQSLNLRWNGSAWRAGTPDTPQTLRSLFGLPGVGVWGVGAGGSILRYAP
jgi:hypothetical protein